MSKTYTKEELVEMMGEGVSVVKLFRLQKKYLKFNEFIDWLLSD